MSTYKEIQNPPEKITRLQFSPYQQNVLMSSSWDFSLRLYNVDKNETLLKRDFDVSLLDCCFQDQNIAWVAGLDGTVRRIDFSTNSEFTLGKHERPTSQICYSNESDFAVSGSWDRTLKIWDSKSDSLVQQIDLPGKAYSLRSSNNKVIVATSEKQICMYDLRDLSTPIFTRKITSPTFPRCVGLSRVNSDVYAVGTIEGRIQVDFIGEGSEQNKHYSFRCHRVMQENSELIYPVNTILFHPEHNFVFISAGSDGVAAIWDAENRRKMYEFERFPVGISSLSFSRDCGMLAVGCCYQFEFGNVANHPPTHIYVCDTKSIKFS